MRLLQTVVDVAAEKNSTLVMPFPVELLRFFNQLADTGRGAAAPVATPPLFKLPDVAGSRPAART